MTGERDDRAEVIAARRAVLAVAVLDDLDVVPGDAGVTVPGASPSDPPVSLRWADVAAAVGTAPPGSALSRRRLLREAALHRALLAPGVPGLHLLALPPGRRPDDAWPIARVPGGALTVGLGVDLGTPEAARRPALVPVPERLRRLLPADRAAVHDLVADRRSELDRLGALAAARLVRQPDVLVPQGPADVPTLLASAPFRQALAAGCPSGLRTVALPSRLRGWLDARRADPGFVPLAYALLDEEEQAFDRVLLVSAEEVALAPGGDVRP